MAVDIDLVIWHCLKKKRAEEKEERNITAAAAATGLFSAGPVPAVFRYATGVWKRTCGD
jgi:hypothetical protein